MPGLKVIYEPKGKAREYAELALNPFTGCDHGCLYCYTPAALRKKRDVFHGSVVPRKDILKSVERDAGILEGDDREILLSFACDIYSNGANSHTTTEVLRTLLGHGLNINILTKGGKRALNDIDMLKTHIDQVRFGTSLVFNNDNQATKYEPGAPSTSERCETLCIFHRSGFKTWASLEPVWSSIDVCRIISSTWLYTDHYKIGKLNYHPHAKEVDWKSTIQEIVDCCEKSNCCYTLKKDTAKLIE